MAKSKNHKKAFVRRYIKLLAHNPNPKKNQNLLQISPDDVIKTICNAAYNVSNGKLKLGPKHKVVFKKYKVPITKLIQRKESLKSKRKILLQKGGTIWIPLLLSTALSALGSALFQ